MVRLASEAETELIGAVIDNLRHDPSSGRMLFNLGSRRGKRFVVVGVRGNRQTFFWAHKKSEIAGFDLFGPTERFNRLKGARLTAVALPHADRLMRADFERPEETTPRHVSLWIGWIGKAGNIWMTESENSIVLETQWKATDEIIGKPFVVPKPPSLIDWRTVDFPEYMRERSQRADDSVGEFVRRRLWGIDAVIAERIVSAKNNGAESSESGWSEFSSVVGYLRTAVDPGTPVELIVRGDSTEAVPLSEESGSDVFPSLATALVARDNAFREESGRESQVAQVSAALEKQLRKAERRLAETERALASAGEAETLKRQADMLGAQRHLIRRGQGEVALTDWQSGVTIALKLDKKLSPQENIEDYYQRARKTARAAENARRTLPEIRAEVERLTGFREELTEDDISDERIAAIGVESGIAATPARPAKRTQQPRLAYREFLVDDFTILVGRSNRENDEVTFRVARPDDLFLHANQVSGSHVIVRSKGRGTVFPKEIVTMAAQIAAYFSKARHSGLVSVIYTPVRHVTKPRKAPPGLVRVQREKSLMVRPLPPPGYHAGDGSE